MATSTALTSPTSLPANIRSTAALVNSLVELPTELLMEVYKYLLPNRESIDITIGHKKRGVIPGDFKQFSNDMRHCKLLFTHPILWHEALAFMWAQNYFKSKNVDSLSKIPVLIGDSVAASIRYFQLTISFQLKVNHLGAWISTLDFLTTKLAKLDRLFLYTEFAHPGAPLVETEGEDRYGQERRALLYMGAYLTLRHPNLCFLAWPAKSGPANEVEFSQARAYVTLYSASEKPSRLGSCMRFETLGDETKKLTHDLILDSTAIRRTPWADLDTKPLSDFALKETADTSEVPEQNRNFDSVHKFSYYPAQTRRHLGDRYPGTSNTGMIHRAQATTTRQEQDRLAGAVNARAGFQGRQGRCAGGFGRGRGRVEYVPGIRGLTNGLGQLVVNGRGRGGFRGRGAWGGNWRGN